VRNSWTDWHEQHPEDLLPFPHQLGKAVSAGAMHLGADESTPGVDPDRECYPAGQGTGAIHDLIPAGDLVRQFVAEAEAALERGRRARV
jgi:enoyl-[acyl-carrier protein] reductase II